MRKLVFELEIGISKTVATIVDENNTAKAVKSGDLAVFSTPMMIALMEQAACECLKDYLEQGQTSVGTKVDINHISASPIGAKITATAVIERIAGREVEFAVTASDERGEIGNGRHIRFIVDEGRFMAKNGD